MTQAATLGREKRAARGQNDSDSECHYKYLTVCMCWLFFPSVCVLFTGAGYLLKMFCAGADELPVCKVGLRPQEPEKSVVFCFLYIKLFMHYYFIIILLLL